MKNWSLKLLPRLAAAALAAPVCAALLAHAYVGLFSRYWYDDFNTAAVLREQGFIGSQRYWYLNWSGRFSFHFAVNLAESAGPLGSFTAAAGRAVGLGGRDGVGG